MVKLYNLSYASVILFFFSVIVAGPANAAWSSISHFSRANCINNESITWNGAGIVVATVSSRHILGGGGAPIYEHHEKAVGLKVVSPNRATLAGVKAIHVGEGVGGWSVYGTHLWFVDGNPNQVRQVRTFARSCNLGQT